MGGVPGLGFRTVSMARVSQRLIGAAGQGRQFEILARYPHVVRWFFMTPHAAEVLERDPSLLARLEQHFETSNTLSDALMCDIGGKGLVVTVFGEPERPNFYGLRGTSQDEMVIMGGLGHDFSRNPTIEDLALAFASEGTIIQIQEGVELTAAQVRTLNNAIDGIPFIGLKVIRIIRTQMLAEHIVDAQGVSFGSGILCIALSCLDIPVGSLGVLLSASERG